MTTPTSTDPRLDPATAARLEKIWNQAYQANSQADLLRLYEEWASTYDEDHAAIGFFGHRTTAEILARHTPFAEVASILDAGCGTGAAGEALWSLGYRNLTGIDLSAEMLAQAEAKRIYRHTAQVDLGLPLDSFPCDHFDAAALVGVFSFGQAPAEALDEIVRVVRPGGVVTFTLRVDFFEQDAMGVRSRMEALDQAHAWRLLEVTEPEPYLPHKDPDALFRVWGYRVLDTKAPPVDEEFAAAVREAFMVESPIKRIDHSFIWNSLASRLYDRYTDCPEYYLTDAEVEILSTHAEEILGDAGILIELGCGSAKKVSELLAAATARPTGRPLTYTPIDVSQGALDATTAEVEARFEEQVDVVPRCGRLDDILASISVAEDKLIVFFGSSIGNLETLAETVAFLQTIRARMTGKDRLVVGVDLHKSEKTLRAAYQAGPRNRSFFLNMIRRMNRELGANFDLDAFRQDSPYLADASYEGLETRSVRLRLVTDQPQEVYISSMHMEVHLDAGDAVQVGTSRKFKADDLRRLGALAGLELTRQWVDQGQLFSLNEFTCAPDA